MIFLPNNNEKKKTIHFMIIIVLLANMKLPIFLIMSIRFKLAT